MAMAPGSQPRRDQPPGQLCLVASDLDLTPPTGEDLCPAPQIEDDEFAHPELLRPGEFSRIEYLDHKLALRRSQLQQQEANLDVMRAQRAHPRVIAQEQAAIDRMRIEIDAKTYRVLRKKVQRDIQIAARQAKRRRLLNSGRRTIQQQHKRQQIMMVTPNRDDNDHGGYAWRAHAASHCGGCDPNQNLTPSCAGRIGPYILSLPAPPGCAPRLGRYYVSQPASARAGSAGTRTPPDLRSMAMMSSSGNPSGPDGSATMTVRAQKISAWRRFHTIRRRRRGRARTGRAELVPNTVRVFPLAAQVPHPLQAVQHGSAQQQTRKRGFDAFVEDEDGDGSCGGYGGGGAQKLARI